MSAGARISESRAPAGGAVGCQSVTRGKPSSKRSRLSRYVADDPVAFGERLELVVPSPPVQRPAAADEDEWKTFARHLVVELRPVDLGRPFLDRLRSRRRAQNDEQ